MEKKCTYDVVGGAKKSFGLAILGRRVGERETEGDAVGGEKRTEEGVDELTTIIALHAFDEHVKLCLHEGKEALEDGGGVGLVAQGEGPRVMGVIIKNYEICIDNQRNLQPGRSTNHNE